MKERIKSFFAVVLLIGASLVVITLLYIHEGKASKSLINTTPPPVVDTVPAAPEFMDKEVHEGLKEALDCYEIKCPDIVYAQAVLETGHFKSDICLNNNNLFGLYNSKTKKYYKFNHWSESVVAYKEWIQKRYKPPEDYYAFLERVHYASDPKYTHKLKQIVKQK